MSLPGCRLAAPVRDVETPSRIHPRDVTAVVPVKNNRRGVARILMALQAMPVAARPARLIVVDNGSQPALEVPRLQGAFAAAVEVLTCVTPGPAAARNVGWRRATTPWILFFDADCVPTESSVRGFGAAPAGAVAYAGKVRAYDQGAFVSYYESQAILEPPATASGRPEYVVTANALVSSAALEEVDGFDERFDDAAGEDIDLALRLRSVGALAFAPEAVMLHEFGNNPVDFFHRFVRYGRGNRRLEQYYGKPMEPLPFAPVEDTPFNRFCAKAQHFAMSWGYGSPRRS